MSREPPRRTTPLTRARLAHACPTGYHPQVSLAEGVERFLAWYSEYYHVSLPAATAFASRNRSKRRSGARRMRGLTEQAAAPDQD